MILQADDDGAKGVNLGRNMHSFINMEPSTSSSGITENLLGESANVIGHTTVTRLFSNSTIV
jgi:hypothetical protein